MNKKSTLLLLLLFYLITYLDAHGNNIQDTVVRNNKKLAQGNADRKSVSEPLKALALLSGPIIQVKRHKGREPIFFIAVSVGGNNKLPLWDTSRMPQ